MKVFTSGNSISKNLIALLLFFACPLLASAENTMPDNDPTAPCGELHLIGKRSYIFNQSSFAFNVHFKMNAGHVRGPSINAGVVKYLEPDSNGNGVWFDTGVGDYRVSKVYTVPVKGNSRVTIAYCAPTVKGLSLMTGEVTFSAGGIAGHNIPEGHVAFEGYEGYVDFIRENQAKDVTFKIFGNTPYVYYNADPSGSTLNGSITICPRDRYCSLP